MPQSIFTELRSSYTFLTRVEKSIAEVVEDNQTSSADLNSNNKKKRKSSEQVKK